MEILLNRAKVCLPYHPYRMLGIVGIINGFGAIIIPKRIDQLMEYILGITNDTVWIVDKYNALEWFDSFMQDPQDRSVGLAAFNRAPKHSLPQALIC